MRENPIDAYPSHPPAKAELTAVTTISTLRLSASRHAFSNRGWRNQIEAAEDQAIGGTSWSRMYAHAGNRSARLWWSRRACRPFSPAPAGALSPTTRIGKVSVIVGFLDGSAVFRRRGVGLCVQWAACGDFHRQAPPRVAAVEICVSPAALNLPVSSRRPPPLDICTSSAISADQWVDWRTMSPQRSSSQPPCVSPLIRSRRRGNIHPKTGMHEEARGGLRRSTRRGR